jgi:quercetin dioxygenase-like cupin family protein/DNA-binding PadR family transcriptional regulator
MPKPRRGYLFTLDARVLSAGATLHRTGHDEFYGLEVARIIGREPSSVYKSLHRLVALGLLEERWEERRRYYRLTPFARESVIHARRGARVFGRLQSRRRRVQPMDFTTRRVVTGHDADGRDVILSDAEAPNTIRANGFGVATWLWLDGPPRTFDVGGDDGDLRLEPPVGGCSVRIIRFPGTGEGGGEWIRVDGDDPDQPGMHATDTLDFMVVIDGRIVLGLDDGEHELGPGDVVIQRANRHRWRVVSDGPCTYVVCMLRPDPDAPAPGEPQQPATSTDAPSPRRLVAATGDDGRSFALVDGAPPCVLSPGADDGVRLVELWQTGGPLGAPDQGGDPEGDWELEPRAGGVAFRSVRLPAGLDSGEAGWHTTATIDVDVVLSGKLELSLPDTPPVVLGPGEAVVQRGTNHSWKPVGDDAVEFVSLMLAVG